MSPLNKSNRITRLISLTLKVVVAKAPMAQPQRRRLGSQAQYMVAGDGQQMAPRQQMLRWKDLCHPIGSRLAYTAELK
jgi:hypothetical protein